MHIEIQFNSTYISHLQQNWYLCSIAIYLTDSDITKRYLLYQNQYSPNLNTSHMCTSVVLDICHEIAILILRFKIFEVLGHFIASYTSRQF